METFIYLIKNREKNSSLKKSIKLFAKRLLTFNILIKIVFKTRKLSNKGAKIGILTIIGNAKIEGHNLKNLKVGNETSIGKVEIALHDNVDIGNKVVINDGVIILTATHRLTDPKWSLKPLPVIIKDFAWIATNSIILPGITIGKGAVIGAGSVVRENVPDYAIVFGNPAKIVDKIERTKDLDYSPVLFNASYEAWLGKAYEK